MNQVASIAKFLLVPQPLQAAVQTIGEAISKKDYDPRRGGLASNALRVNTYIAMRIALAGALCYAFRHHHPDALIATFASAAFSVPATALYWGGKFVFEGGKAVAQNFRTPLTREFAMGLGKYLLGTIAILSNHHRGFGDGLKKGVVEWIATKIITPGLYDKKSY